MGFLISHLDNLLSFADSIVFFLDSVNEIKHCLHIVQMKNAHLKSYDVVSSHWKVKLHTFQMG